MAFDTKVGDRDKRQHTEWTDAGQVQPKRHREFLPNVIATDCADASGIITGAITAAVLNAITLNLDIVKILLEAFRDEVHGTAKHRILKGLVAGGVRRRITGNLRADEKTAGEITRPSVA